MQLKQIVRLIEWLKSKGMTEEEVYECLEYVANEKVKKATKDETE